ncbi:MAG: hypothetical protein JSV64_04230 [Candidatus Bathyarchaeota archaeon]|jgi:hypothetical protein|nr:MAG: hypothetical protein JSV64_04230 [Candidatus Bathyarchaeota archaeon]
MPISVKEFNNGKLHSKLEGEITSFLEERKDRGFTTQEVMEGLHYHADFTTPEISRISSFVIADFTTFLHQLVERGKIRMKIVRGRTYVMAAAEAIGKCPRCGLKAEKPKKTWKMAGRPSKTGERLELTIGLFECPKHGSFRKVLSKNKIRTQRRSKDKPRRKNRKGPSKKGRRVVRKSKKESAAWLVA